MRRAVNDVCAQPNAREFSRKRHCRANSNVNQHIVQLHHRFSLLYVNFAPVLVLYAVLICRDTGEALRAQPVQRQ